MSFNGGNSGGTDTIRDRRKSSAQVKAAEKALEQQVIAVDASELSEEDRKLAELGYIQVYKREFSWLSCISFAVSISGLFASVCTTFVYPLEAGGAASAVWCWLISGAGCMCITISVSELASAYPTSGGMYFTCKYLAPATWMPEISWLCGWFSVLGQLTGLASTEYGCGQLLLAAVSMASGPTPDGFRYMPTARQTVGVTAAITFMHASLNSLNTSYLEKITRTYVLFHLGVLLSCCIALLVMCDYKNSSSYVWTEVVPDSGWAPPGWSFLFGFLSVSWTMTDYDATAHIAEEIRNPEIKAPWSITLALAFTYVGGWLFTIVLSYCTGDVGTLLETPLEQPVAQIFYNVIGPTGGTVFTVFAFIIMNFTGVTGMQAGARTYFAVARDEMIPFSRILATVNKTTHTPLYAVWCISTLSVCINLIGLGSYTAISAIFNMTAIALDWSYCIPILCKMVFGQFQPGPFYLGRASFFVNLWAVIWTLFVSIIFILPTIRPVTAENMNYASVVLAGISLFAVIYWYAAGRFYYTGPRVKAVVDERNSFKGTSDLAEKDIP